MRIVVDDAIPYWESALARLGDVRALPGRRLRAPDVRDADALVVRSVTRVDSSLLDGSAVRFVGSATIGMDHLDTDYLTSSGIRFTNAAGCNANAVAEYIVAALLLMAERKGWDLRDRSVAVVGVGNVGSRVEQKARALGMKVLLCDPPLRDATGDARYHSSLAEVLDADVLTFHVPLTTGGPYPTRHMVDGGVMENLSARQFLINTARGPVIDGGALKKALAGGRLEGAALDVWEGEPGIDLGLLELADIGTPHIAGYSVDGKIRATEMMFEALCRHFHVEASWDTRALFPAAARIRPPEESRDELSFLRSVVLQAYDILRDDSALRSLLSQSPEHARVCFDRLRNEYSFRPEFRHFSVELTREKSRLAGLAGTLGFRLARPEGE